MREWILSEVNYQFIKESPYEVAVLPIGATEPHNLHLPYGTDNIQVEAMASRACELAWEQGARVGMLPTIPYGTETNMGDFPFAMNVQPSTIGQLIADLVDSLSQQGIHKLLILNGHGGNDLKPLLRELFGQTPVNLFLCDWFRGIAADLIPDLFDVPGDHADEIETSLVLALRPDLVMRDEQTGELKADEGGVRSSRFEAVNEGWVSLTRPWRLLTTNTGSGNPHKASAEKGEKLFETITVRLADFLTQLAHEEIDETFPFE